MLFSEIIGQEGLKERLIREVRENRISHARLFLGPEGAGSLPLAIAYAQYVNCGNRSETDPCGKCLSCIKYNKLMHPDLHFVFPVIKSGDAAKEAVSDMFIKEWRAEIIKNPYITYNQWRNVLGTDNKQGSMFVEESREIIRKIGFKAYEAEYKVMIIWMAERMHEKTANKLLKILEEPPEKTLFLLIAESSDLMLPTILSRTQLTHVPKIDSQSLADHLVKSNLCGEQQAADMAHISNGNLAQALAILQSSKDEVLFLDLFIRMMRTCWSVWRNKQAMLELLAWCDEVTSLNRENQKAYLMYCLRMVRENFIQNRRQPQLSFLNEKEHEFSQKFNAFIHPDNVFRLTEELNRAYRHIDANGNKNIVFLDMACKIVVLLKNQG
ncbi:MAG: DNA polymerase III subunit delta [Bacteroidales bacterium]|jgi:DNA polymerase-3 subunit delta'|nr:DNA polymerase III subunit delta [Bacteroidales bacterium]